MKKYLHTIVLSGLLITAFAHEYILLAYKYKVQKGDTLEMHLFVADGFNIQLERPLQAAITKKFQLISESGTTDLLAIAKNEALPVVNTKVDFDGLGLVCMERDYAGITLPTPKFRDYLKEDNIENIVINNNRGVQRERYSRYIKSLVQSKIKENDTLYKKITGHNFEIVLLQNPYLLHTGDVLKARIFFKGKPLTGKIITAHNRIGSEPSLKQTSRTDANGICSFKLSRKGEWFIHATHMIPCTDKADSDWESFWASYSFGIE